MSSPSSKIFICLRWLCLLAVFYISTPSCQGSKKLCGKELPDALDLVCGGKFGKKTKKSFDPGEYYADIDEDILLFGQSPFLSKFSALSLAKTRRRRAGVYDECCKKACNVEELRTYCS